jgi:hypothetical protein
MVLSMSNFLLTKQDPEVSLRCTTTYQYSDLLHDIDTDRTISVILHYIGQKPVTSFYNKQNALETANYQSEFMVACHKSQHVIDLTYTLRIMDIPLNGQSWMFTIMNL